MAAVYASGQGGVCRDMRYPAWGLTQEDFAETDLAIKSGKYRGREFIESTKVYDIGNITATAPSGTYIGLNYVTDGLSSNIKSLSNNEFYFVVNKSTLETFDSRSEDLFLTPASKANLYYPESWGNSVDVFIVYISIFSISLSGEYLHTEVIAPPANILLCDDLKDGWIGSWNPTIPDGTLKTVKGEKPCEDHTLTYSTGDQGQNWSTSSPVSFENPENSYSSAFSSNGIWIVIYKTKAKMTKDSVNSEIYGGDKGIGRIDASSSFRVERGALLNYSLTGKVQTNTLFAENLGQRFHSKPALLDYAINGATLTSVYSIVHQELLLGVPNNSSSSCKSLNYNVVENQQGFINYAYTELTYDQTAGDWGDDSKIHIADNQTTMPDENGNTVLVGTAQIVEPLGWIKNDK